MNDFTRNVLTLGWLGVAVYAIWAAHHMMQHAVDTLAKTATSLQEYRAKLKAPDEPIPVPEDLAALAASESEAWAQRDMMRVIRERYDDLHDWNLVRTAMGVAQK